MHECMWLLKQGKFLIIEFDWSKIDLQVWIDIFMVMFKTRESFMYIIYARDTFNLK